MTTARKLGQAMTITDGAHTRGLLASNHAAAAQAREAKQREEAAALILHALTVEIKFGRMTFLDRSGGVHATVIGGIIGGALVIDDVQTLCRTQFQREDFAEAVALRLRRNAAARTARLREELAARNAVRAYGAGAAAGGNLEVAA